MATVVIDPPPEIIKQLAARCLAELGVPELAHPEVRDGRDAARAGLTLADCPYSPADPAGKHWRRGWLDATAVARMA